MKKLPLAFAIFMILTLFSCRTAKVEYKTVEVPVVHQEFKTDTLHDSIHVTDSVFIHTKGDTVYSEKFKTVYKWRDKIEIKKKVDTVTVVKPIPVEVEKPIIVEVEKELTKRQKLRMQLGDVFFAILVVGLIFGIVKLKKRFIP